MATGAGGGARMARSLLRAFCGRASASSGRSASPLSVRTSRRCAPQCAVYVGPRDRGVLRETRRQWALGLCRRSRRSHWRIEAVTFPAGPTFCRAALYRDAEQKNRIRDQGDRPFVSRAGGSGDRRIRTIDPGADERGKAYAQCRNHDRLARPDGRHHQPDASRSARRRGRPTVRAGRKSAVGEGGQRDRRASQTRPQPSERSGRQVRPARAGEGPCRHHHPRTEGRRDPLSPPQRQRRLSNPCLRRSRQGHRCSRLEQHGQHQCRLAVASQKWETLSINGTDEYKEKAARLAAEHGYKLSNPELQDRIKELRAEIEASRERNAEGESRADAKSAPSHKPEAAQDSDSRSATKLSESQLADRAIRAAMPEARSLRDEIDSYKDDIASARDERYRELSIKRLADAEGRLEAFLSKPLERNAEAPDPETRLNKTPAEQELRLQDIRGRVEREAERETDQAKRARAAHETNVAQGSEQTPYRSPEEAQSARAAERGMENDAHRPLPADVRQSEEMANLTAQQRRLLELEAEQRRIDIENADRANREYEQRRHTESEGESE